MLCNEEILSYGRGQQSEEKRYQSPHTVQMFLVLVVAIRMMKWTEFRVCVTIVAGHSTAKINMLLILLKVNKCHVYHVKKLFRQATFVIIHKLVNLIPLAQKMWSV